LGRAPGRAARRPCIAFAIVALHIAFAGRYGWFRDELYYVACGQRLALGYVDHQPLVAFVARIANALFGDSLIGLRSFAAICAGATVLSASATARAFGGGRVAQIVAALGVALAPYDLVVGHIYTMNAFEPVIWGGIGLVVALSIRAQDARRLVWLGPIVGVGMDRSPTRSQRRTARSRSRVPPTEAIPRERLATYQALSLTSRFGRSRAFRRASISCSHDESLHA
jgi:hypothetical protein